MILRMLALLIFLTLSASASTLVTDIDDTIKMTDVSDLGLTVIRGLFGAPAFAGMATLYGAMDPEHELIALSGGPQFTAGKVKRFLDDSGFHASIVLLKPSLFDNTSDHKVRWLNKLAEQRGGGFILVGDDTEKDPESFERFRAMHADRVTAMYIRIVVDRPVPDGIKRFHTALDIADEEFLAGRLSSADFMKVGLDLLQAPDDTFLPEYAACPLRYLTDDRIHDAAVAGMRHAVGRRLLKLCGKRYSNPNWRRFYDRKRRRGLPQHGFAQQGFE
ncbi:MAG: DUF2183 domain-containing protein [Deltaproteobacteria bacterium]|nr:DUF2183 domain-containing protein [Deltaproteobacteria bacterium]